MSLPLQSASHALPGIRREERGQDEVAVVAHVHDSPLAKQVARSLSRALFRAQVVSARALEADAAAVVLLDDPSLPEALRRLARLMPGQATYSNVILVVEEPERCGGLLAEGVRDVVSPDEAAEAVAALVRGRPPLFLVRVRDQIDRRFFREMIATLQDHAFRRRLWLVECVEILRQIELIRRRVRALEDTVMRQAIDDLLLAAGQTESYLLDLREEKPVRLDRLPRPPEPRPLRFPSEREPQLQGAQRRWVPDLVEAMRARGWMKHADQGSMEALARLAEEHRSRPLGALRDYARSLERLLAERRTAIEALDLGLDPLALVQRDCLARYHFGVLPPGIAAPDYLVTVLRSVAQPPAEIYLTWVIDLRDMAVKPCSAVLEDVRDAVSGAEKGGR